jgi:predicted  nucleic acid-binding Zn-ribbon protein
MSPISILFRLQQIDSQLDIAQNSLRVIEDKINDSSAIDLAQEKVIEADQKYKDELKILRERENKSYDTHIKIELSETALYGGKIQNPKELQDLQKEIASLKRLIITLEDKELSAMMAVEEAETELARANDFLQEAEAKKIEQDASLKGEKTKLLAQIERLEAERKAALPAISKDDLNLYEQLRKLRSGVAVAKISSRACEACGATLTAALIQTTQMTGQLVRCPTCGRILYAG